MGGIMVYGYGNRIAFIDLTKGKVKIRKPKESILKEYIGGKGLGARLLYDMLPPKIDPLSPSNILIFAVGPLTGTGAPASARGVIVTKSPATWTFNDSNGGGFFTSYMKLAGYDALVFLGRAEKLSYVYIDHDGKIHIRDATHISGYGVYATEDTLKDEVGDKDAKVASIGPAGENLVKIAGVVVDKHHIHARGGSGAVMGSKNLKAVVVSADKNNPRYELAYPDEFNEFNRRYIKEKIFSEEYSWAKDGGTPVIVQWSNEAGLFPTKNFQDGVFDGWEDISAEILKSYRTSKAACYRCTIACRNLVKIRHEKFGEVFIDGPEYETIAMVGGSTGLGDFKAIVSLNALLDDMGMDSISAGNIIGYVMELYEKGYISKDDLGGLEAKWGDPDVEHELVKMIAYRRGFGDIMAEGVKGIASYIGGDSYKFAIEVKGLEYPAYDPRGSYSMALAYATSDRGACHLRAWSIVEEAFGDKDPYIVEGKAEIVIRLQDLNAIKWSMVWCDFLAINYEDMSTYLRLATGWDLKPEELRYRGEKIWNLIRLFNLREGFTRRDDYAPYRILHEPLKSGPAKDKVIGVDNFNKMLDEYYRLRGWNKDGVPLKKTLRRLRLSKDYKRVWHPLN
ncbi:MAG TPA: aldehyde ferredoxin oxidoreductase [Thermoprotei archaeon]|nr:aldehyde ferredoxin oxidoreductase [Thermoprotei archaeon]